MARRTGKTALAGAINLLQNSKDKTKRLNAVHRLGKLDDKKAIPVLVSLLTDEDRAIRALAASKLIFLNNAAAVPGLIRALDDTDFRVRQHAVYALRRMKIKKCAPRFAEMLIADPAAVVRYNAALALAELGGKAQKPAVLKALYDRESTVVLHACRALAVIIPREAHKHILKLVCDRKRWGRILFTHKDVVLKLLENDLAKPEVRRVLRGLVGTRAENGRQSLAAAEAGSLLAKAGDPAAIGILRKCLQGVDYSQERGLVGLALLKDAGSVPLIIKHALQNGFYPIKLKAVQALGEIGDTRALSALAALFDTSTDSDFPVEMSTAYSKDDPDLRLAALEAILKITAGALKAGARNSEGYIHKKALAAIQRARSLRI